VRPKADVPLYPILRYATGNHISDLAWSRLGVEPAELSEIAVVREIFWVLLELLLRDPSQTKSGHKNELMNEYVVLH